MAHAEWLLGTSIFSCSGPFVPSRVCKNCRYLLIMFMSYTKRVGGEKRWKMREMFLQLAASYPTTTSPNSAPYCLI